VIDGALFGAIFGLLLSTWVVYLIGCAILAAIDRIMDGRL